MTMFGIVLNGSNNIAIPTLPQIWSLLYKQVELNNICVCVVPGSTGPHFGSLKNPNKVSHPFFENKL